MSHCLIHCAGERLQRDADGGRYLHVTDGVPIQENQPSQLFLIGNAASPRQYPCIRTLYATRQLFANFHKPPS
jgi:hypothetical protein